MELRQLRNFREVATLLSFSQAARRLRLGQPALSRQIRALEDELGFRLLDRTTARVALSREGAHFLERIHEVLNSLDRAILSTQQLRAEATRKLQIAVDWNVTLPLTAAVRLMRQRHPGVKIQFVDSASHQHVDSVLARQVDVAIVPGIIAPRPRPRALVFEKVSRMVMHVLVPADHPLSRRRSVRFAELKDETWITLDEKRWPSFRAAFLQFARSAGFRPRIGKSTTNVVSLIPMVLAGNGIALLAETALPPIRSGSPRSPSPICPRSNCSPSIAATPPPWSRLSSRAPKPATSNNAALAAVQRLAPEAK